MLSLLKKIICNLILFVVPLTCLLSLGCGKGAYDEKLETAVQRAASGTPREKKQDDASLEELYPLADDDEDADADEDDGYEDEDDADADDT